MSTADTDAVTVAADGISVEKSFEPGEFPVPAIAFTVQSERDTPATLRLVDDLPDGVSPEDVGFHPDYGDECWTVEGQQIVFEREFEPGESFTTVYGLRDGEFGSGDEFLGAPDVETTSTANDPVGTNNSQVVRDVIAGAADTVPGLEDEGDDEEIAPLDLNDPDARTEGSGDRAGVAGPSESTEAPEPSADDPDEPDEAPTDDATADGDDGEGDTDAHETGGEGGGSATESSIATALVDELRAGEVDGELAAALRTHLGVDGTNQPVENSVETRLKHVQSGLSDMRAYVDALEAFIDEEGEAKQVLGDLRRAVEALDARVDGVGERVTAVDDRVSTIDDRAEGMSDRLGTVEDETEERFGTVEDRLDSLSDRTDDAVTEVTDRLDDVEADIDRMEALADRLDGLEEDLDRVESLTERVDSVESDLGDRMDDIESDFAEFEGFRERMATVFGGAGDGSATPDGEPDEDE